MHDLIALLRKILAAISATEPRFEYNDNSWDEWVCPLCQVSQRAVYEPPGHCKDITMADLDHDDACPWLALQQLGALGLEGFLTVASDTLGDADLLVARYQIALENLTQLAGKANEEFVLPEREGEWRSDVENMVRFLQALVFDAERARAMGAASKSFELWRIINMGISPQFSSTPVYEPERDYEAEILFMMRRLDEQARALETIMRVRGDRMGFLRAMRDAIRDDGSGRGNSFRHGDGANDQAAKEAQEAVADLAGVAPDALAVMVACYIEAWVAAYQRGVEEVRQGGRQSSS